MDMTLQEKRSNLLTPEREIELRKIQGMLRSRGLIFAFSHHYLFHKSNSKDVARDASFATLLLSKMGHNLHVIPGIFERETFALKSAEGLVLQRLKNALRIFYRTNSV